MPWPLLSKNDSRPEWSQGLHQSVSISEDAVFAGLSAARNAAGRLAAKVCIAVVDGAGTLVGFIRQADAFLISSDLAIDKAWTSAGFRLSTSGFGELLVTLPQATRDGLLNRPRVTQVPGGFPVILGDQCVGAIGVSGGSAEQDEEIATAALAAIEEELR